MNYELLRSEAKFVIPFLPEASDERFSQELIEADAAFHADADGFLADVPAMIVETRQRPQLLFADRVEVATDGLLSQQASFRASESAVAAANYACHEFAFRVGIGNALPVNDSLRTCGKLWPQAIELCLYVCYLVQRDRRSGITFFAAASVAAVYVAAELLRHDVRVQDDVTYLDEVTKRLVFAHAE